MAHERYRRQTDDGRAIAYSERSLKNHRHQTPLRWVTFEAGILFISIAFEALPDKLWGNMTPSMNLLYMAVCSHHRRTEPRWQLSRTTNFREVGSTCNFWDTRADRHTDRNYHRNIPKGEVTIGFSVVQADCQFNLKYSVLYCICTCARQTVHS